MVESKGEEDRIVERALLEKTPVVGGFQAWKDGRIGVFRRPKERLALADFFRAADGLAIQRLEPLDERLHIGLEDAGVGPYILIALDLRRRRTVTPGQIRQRAFLPDKVGQALVEADAAFDPDGLVQQLVDMPGEAGVSATEGQHTVIIKVWVAPTDVGKVIGKKGRIADALRIIVNAAAAKQGKRALLEIIEE